MVASQSAVKAVALPDFLVIGAMKAATTSLYEDLKRHPGIFLPLDKEPEDLASDEVLTPRGLQGYARLFRDARPGQLVGEASTAYSKRPDVEGVAERARALMGERLKIIYMVRDPIERMVSHYRHDWLEGAVVGAIGETLLREPRYVNYSRYHYQLEPWILAFGWDQILVVRFEDYTRDRVTALSRILHFLGVDCAQSDFALSSVANASGDKRLVRRSPVASLVRSRFYRRSIKPRVPDGLRRALARALLPSSRHLQPPDDLEPEIASRLRDRLSAADLSLSKVGDVRPGGTDP